MRWEPRARLAAFDFVAGDRRFLDWFWQLTVSPFSWDFECITEEGGGPVNMESSKQPREVADF